MIEIFTIDWFGRWGTSVFSENTAIFLQHLQEFAPEKISVFGYGIL